MTKRTIEIFDTATGDTHQHELDISSWPTNPSLGVMTLEEELHKENPNWSEEEYLMVHWGFMANRVEGNILHAISHPGSWCGAGHRLTVTILPLPEIIKETVEEWIARGNEVEERKQGDSADTMKHPSLKFCRCGCEGSYAIHMKNKGNSPGWHRRKLDLRRY